MSGRVRLVGIQVDNVNMDEAVSRCMVFLRLGGSHLVVTPNAEMLQACRESKALRAIVADADLVVPDGAGVVLASRLAGAPLKERVAGIELADAVLGLLAERGGSVYLLGAAPGVADAAARALGQRHPGLRVGGCHDGYFGPQEEHAVAQTIRAAQPDLLLVGMGVPRQEHWLSQWLETTGATVGMAVGGAFDVWSGRTRRAPRWMRRTGLEWAYRLLAEPQRLRRMLAIPRFLWAALWEH